MFSSLIDKNVLEIYKNIYFEIFKRNYFSFQLKKYTSKFHFLTIFAFMYEKCSIKTDKLVVTWLLLTIFNGL